MKKKTLRKKVGTHGGKREGAGKYQTFASGPARKVNHYFAKEHLSFLDRVAKKMGVNSIVKRKDGSRQNMGRGEALRRIIEIAMVRDKVPVPERSHLFSPVDKQHSGTCYWCGGMKKSHPNAGKKTSEKLERLAG